MADASGNPESPRPALDYAVVEAFLADLRRDGLRIGAREEIATARLFAELVISGAVKAPGELRPFLQPILARNEEDVARFSRAFVRWFGGKEQPDLPPLPEVTIKIRKKSGGAIWIALALLAIAAGGGALWYSLREQPVPIARPSTSLPPPSPPVPAPPQPDDPADEKGATDARTAVLEVLKLAGERRLEPAFLAPTIAELAQGAPLTLDDREEDIAAAWAEAAGLPLHTPLPILTDPELVARLALAKLAVSQPAAAAPSPDDLIAAARDVLANPPADSGLPQPGADNESAAVYWIGQELGGSQSARLVALMHVSQRAAGNPLTRAELQRLLDGPLPRSVDPLLPAAIQRGLSLWNWSHPEQAVVIDDPNRLDDRPPWLAEQLTQGAPLWAPAVGAVLPLMFLIFWLLSSVERKKAFLRRRAPDYPPALHDLVAQVGKTALGVEAQLRRAAQQLQQWSSRESDTLDIRRTLELSLRNGAFTPVRTIARAQPSYLVLIESAGVGDQNTARLRALVRQMEDRHISVDVYYYQNDPSWLHPEPWGARDANAPFSAPPLNIDELVHRYPHHRLIVMGEGARLLDPVRGEPTPVAQALVTWPSRALLTPRPIAEWGAREFAIAQQLGLPVGRATSGGLVSLGGLLGLDSVEQRNDVSFAGDGGARAMPRELRERLDRWMTDIPASSVSWGELQALLRKYLDTDAFNWFAACAVYPELRWDLTLFLGVTVKRLDGAPLYDENRLAALTQLPWFRLGRIPDWLRARLIGELKDRAGPIRAALAQMVETARADGASAIGDENTRLKIATARPGAEDVMDDQIFLEFLARGQATDLEVNAIQGIKKLAPKPLRDAFDKSGWLVAFLGVLAITAVVLMTPIGGKLGLLDPFNRLDAEQPLFVAATLCLAAAMAALACLIIVDRHALRIRVERRVPGWLLLAGDMGFAGAPWIVLAALALVFETPGVFAGIGATPVEIKSDYLFRIPVVAMVSVLALLTWRYRTRRMSWLDLPPGLAVALAINIALIILPRQGAFGAFALPAVLVLGLIALSTAIFGERRLSREATWMEMSRWRKRPVPKRRPLFASASSLALLSGLGAAFWYASAEAASLPPDISDADITASNLARTVIATRQGIWRDDGRWRLVMPAAPAGSSIVRLTPSFGAGCGATVNLGGDVTVVPALPASASTGEARPVLAGTGIAVPAPLMSAGPESRILIAQTQQAGADRLFLSDACSTSGSQTVAVAEPAAGRRGRTTAIHGDNTGFVVGDGLGRVWMVRPAAGAAPQAVDAGMRFGAPIQRISADPNNANISIEAVGGKTVVATWSADGLVIVSSNLDPVPAAAVPSPIERTPRPLVKADPKCAQINPLVLLFNSDKTTLSQSYETDFSNALGEIADNGRDGCKLGLAAVVGHTDTLEWAAGGDQLSLDRANRIRGDLLAKGVAAGAIWVDGEGKSRLAAPTADGVAEPRNRRVELTFTMVADPDAAPPQVVPRLAASDPECGAPPDIFVIYFEWDRTDLTTNNREIVRQAISRANASAACEIGEAQVVGHTDTSGAASYNQRKSVRAGQSVASALVAAGLPQNRIQSYGVGETDLAHPTADGVREPLNRNATVQFRMVKKSTVSPPTSPPPPPPPPPLPPPPPAILSTTSMACAIQPDPFTVYFEADSSTLTANNNAIVGQAVSRAKAGGCSITLISITGHTDTFGGAADNDRLSARIADTVKQAVIAQGIPAGSIRTAARGENDLAKATADGVRDPLNRRAVVQITIGR